MAQQRPILQADPRDRIGTRYARRLRSAGKLPAVVYGHDQDPAHVAVDQHDLVHALHSGAHLIELAAAGASQVCLIKAVQYDHLGTDIIHVDLARVDLSDEVTVSVPIVVQGEDVSAGLKQAGAFLSQHIVDIEVICRADSIPDHVAADISTLEAGHALSVEKLSLPPGVRIDRDPRDIVVAIEITKEEEEVVAAPAAEGAEPEVLTARKEEQEGGEAKKDADKEKK